MIHEVVIYASIFKGSAVSVMIGYGLEGNANVTADNVKYNMSSKVAKW